MIVVFLLTYSSGAVDYMTLGAIACGCPLFIPVEVNLGT
jgi:hypothetical protein